MWLSPLWYVAGSDREGAAATGSTQLSGSAAVAAAAGAGMLSDSSRPWYSSTSLASSDLASPTVRLPNSVPPSQTNGKSSVCRLLNVTQ